MTTKQTGDHWEIIAIKYLQKHWYTIKDVNYKFGRFGEIDIICDLNWITIFVEVKYRTNIKYGIPEEAITPYKLRKCIKTLDYYSVVNKINLEKRRFDVIAILKWTKSYKITHYRNINL